MVSIGLATRDRQVTWTRAAMFLLISGLVLRIAGVPSLDLHGPLHYLGIMDPLCGGTRATYLLWSGEPTEAARYNPLVFPLSGLLVIQVARAAMGWTTGRWVEIRFSARARRFIRWTLLIAIAALAVRQQLHAELLMQPWR